MGWLSSWAFGSEHFWNSNSFFSPGTHGPPGPNRSEFFKIMLVLVCSEIGFFSRSGPRLRTLSWSELVSENLWSWSGLRILNFVRDGTRTEPPRFRSVDPFFSHWISSRIYWIFICSTWRVNVYSYNRSDDLTRRETVWEMFWRILLWISYLIKVFDENK